jgi:hypothetical protein
MASWGMTTSTFTMSGAGYLPLLTATVMLSLLTPPSSIQIARYDPAAGINLFYAAGYGQGTVDVVGDIEKVRCYILFSRPLLPDPSMSLA